jgi:diguanylate cyclase (GGDEF)-like protein
MRIVNPDAGAALTAARRTINVDEERVAAARVAGILFLVAGGTVPLLPLLPGVERDHWAWLFALGVPCILWAVYCLALARPERRGPLFWHVPSVGALVVIAGTAAATGGANSPARFYLLFLLVYVAYFFTRWQALPYVCGAVVVALLPLAYDGDAVEAGYVGELIVVCPAYLLLGMLINEGKRTLIGLREQARALSLRDPLTDLPNRRAVREWLERRMHEGGDPLGLVLVDLDGFKDVNTVHGYPEGDRVLVETARLLRTCVRSGDMAARLGGDEFAVLITEASEPGMRALADRILACLRGMEERLELAGVRLTASLGWVLYPRDASSIDELVAAADVCMRGAKRTGKDRALSALDWAA